MLNMTSGAPGARSARPPGISTIEYIPLQDLSVLLRFFQRTNMTTTLYDVLANSLISSRVIPYLPISSLLALASTSHQYRDLILRQPELSTSFKYLDLSLVKCATFPSGAIDVGGNSWRAERMDEALTEDDFYSGPLRGIFNRLHRHDWLHLVSTLVLDGLTVPTEIVREVVMEDRFNVRILSIRDTQQLNQRKLCQTLKYVVRPSRPAGTPKLRALYVFGPKDPVPAKEEEHVVRRRSPTRFPDSRPSEVARAAGARLGEEWNRRSQETLAKELCDHNDDKWYHSAGKLIQKTPHSDWAETLIACEGIIHFDAVLCRGPRHDPLIARGGNEASFLPPAVATVALGSNGCNECKTCPEGPAVFGQSPSYQIPLLAPPPSTSISIRAAQIPSSAFDHDPRMIVRCLECLRNRWCERCHKWWCESCYDPDSSGNDREGRNSESTGGHQPNEIKMGAIRDCFGCGQTCGPCKDLYQRACTTCNSEYCVLDNDGCSPWKCDWCNHSGRRTRELY